MPNTSRSIIGVYNYWNAQGGVSHLNLAGYAGTGYWTASGFAAFPSSNISLNGFYGTSPINEWGAPPGGK